MATWLLCAAVTMATGMSAVDTQPASADSPALALIGDKALAGARSEVYKTVAETELQIHMFFPPEHQPADHRPAIVFFFGGGWLHGSAGQFAPQCRHLAARGMVAMTADYRVYTRHQAKVADCVADAQDAIRWVRAHAKKLGVDPDRIAAGGGSAGGHLAAACAMLNDLTGTKDDKAVSFRPNALVLFNPALDLTPEGGDGAITSRLHTRLKQRLGDEPRDLSPADHVRAGLPPTLILHGKADQLIPYVRMEEFQTAMRKVGNRCELVGYEGQGHAFFNPAVHKGKFFAETIQQAESFLKSLGYIGDAPASKPGD